MSRATKLRCYLRRKHTCTDMDLVWSSTGLAMRHWNGYSTRKVIYALFPTTYQNVLSGQLVRYLVEEFDWDDIADPPLEEWRVETFTTADMSPVDHVFNYLSVLEKDIDNRPYYTAVIFPVTIKRWSRQWNLHLSICRANLSLRGTYKYRF